MGRKLLYGKLKDLPIEKFPSQVAKRLCSWNVCGEIIDDCFYNHVLSLHNDTLLKNVRGQTYPYLIS